MCSYLQLSIKYLSLYCDLTCLKACHNFLIIQNNFVNYNLEMKLSNIICPFHGNCTLEDNIQLNLICRVIILPYEKVLLIFHFVFISSCLFHSWGKQKDFLNNRSLFFSDLQKSKANLGFPKFFLSGLPDLPNLHTHRYLNHYCSTIGTIHITHLTHLNGSCL